MPWKIVKKLVTRLVKGIGSKSLSEKRTRRVFTDEFRREALGWSLGEFQCLVPLEGGAAEEVGANTQPLARELC